MKRVFVGRWILIEIEREGKSTAVFPTTTRSTTSPYVFSSEIGQFLCCYYEDAILGTPCVMCVGFVLGHGLCGMSTEPPKRAECHGGLQNRRQKNKTDTSELDVISLLP